ncbi:MAG: tRNA (guanosine(37)-N1)-methyltransferase TrmD [Candidatus Pacebacteria bacterium]|nr:tRNA (guanosine(37)-N1)-methyltransferase TrmD [Candidatus Paceibacterota bacterium]
MLNFHIITIFPEMFDSYLKESILKRAIKSRKISVKFYNPRDWAGQSNNLELTKPIDDTPFGGGPGMVLKAEPFLKAIQKAVGRKTKYKIYYFSPRGKKFNTKMAKDISQENRREKLKDIILVSGRYEGIDSRVEEIYKGERISVGEFVLTGGELPAMILIDSISRQIDGILGNKFSLEEDRISAGKFYTKPAELKWKGKKYKIPEVLLSGNHKKIDEWKAKNA